MNAEKRQAQESQESFQEKKDRELFDGIVDQYCRKDLVASSRIPRQYRLLRTLSVIPWRSGFKVLEVGCGCGYSADYLSGVYAEYTGVDYAKRLIEYARKFNSRENVRFEAVNINDFDPYERMDVVFMIGVLHHADEYEKCFERILGMVKPGGWLIVNEAQSGNFLVQFARKIRTFLDTGYSRDQRPFSYKQLKELFEKHGLENVTIVPQGILSAPLAEVVLKPVFIFKVIALVLVFLDKCLENAFGAALRHASWNLIAAGRKNG